MPPEPTQQMLMLSLPALMLSDIHVSVQNEDVLTAPHMSPHVYPYQLPPRELHFASVLALSLGLAHPVHVVSRVFLHACMASACMTRLKAG